MGTVGHSAFGQDVPHGWSLSLNVPGVGVRWVGRALGVEARVQSLSSAGERTSFAGLRFFRFFSLSSRLHWYPVIETGIFRYEDSGVTAKGGVVGAFIGVERALTDRLSLNIDAGPSYGRADAGGGVEGSTLDLAINTSLQWHIGRRRS